MKKKMARVSLLLLTFLLLWAQVPFAFSNGIAKAESNSLVFDFEDGTLQGWGARGGSVVLTVTDGLAYEGDHSVFVTGRTQGWNGLSHSMNDYMEQGKTYAMSAWVRLPEGVSNENISILVQRTTNGETFYESVGARTANSSQWVKVTGQYQLKHQFENISVYLESFDNATLDFYVDQVELTVIPDPEPITIEEDIPSLKDVFADDFILGTALIVNEIEDVNGPGAELLKKHFNSLTPGNELKWDATEPREGQFTFERADKIVDFAMDNNIPVRGHTLIWHSQTPDWVFYDDNGDLVSKEVLYERMENHINEVMGRYKGKIYAWDVVNEVIEPSDRKPGGLRNSLWYQIAGEEYIEKAFEFAHQADPDAILYINDYNTHQPVKRQNLYDLVKRLKDKGIPVQGVGHQTHISIQDPPLHELDAMIEAFRDLDVEQQITELDMSVYTNDSQAYETFPIDLQIKQAHRYKALFDIFKKHSDQLTAVIFWGKDDANTWLTTFPVVRNNWPLLFDERMQSKYAYWALVDPSRLPLNAMVQEASQGTITVDGSQEGTWSINRRAELKNNDDIVGSFRTLWNENNLYVLVEVNDETISENDSVEIFIDRNNGKTDFYESDDEKLTFVRGSQQNNASVHYKTTEKDKGYLLEVAIPLEEAQIGSELGFEVRITDDKNSEVVTTSWNDEYHAQDEDTSRFGVLRLVEGARLTTALYGSPEVDGEIDSIWENAHEIVTDQYISGANGATAVVKTMWDEEHLYVLARVSDQAISKVSANVWEQDSFEIFVDPNNEKSDSYQEDDGQYRINFDNETSFNPVGMEQYLTSATAMTEDGYVVEAAIAWSISPPAVGSMIGFDVQVNSDDNNDGVRDTITIWNDLTGNSWASPAGFGLLQLQGDSEEPTPSSTPDPTPSIAPSSTPDPTPSIAPSSTPGPTPSIAPSSTPRPTSPASSTPEPTSVVTISDTSFNEALNQVKDGSLQLKVEGANANEWTAELNANQLKQAQEAGVQTILLSSPSGNVELTLATLLQSQQNVSVTLAKKGEEIRIGIKVGEKQLNQLPDGETLKITYPYNVKVDEKNGQLVVYRVNQDGTKTLVPHVYYERDSGQIIIVTNQAGQYMVQSVNARFTDLARVAWAQEAIEALVARGIMEGTSETIFDPNRSVTREQFIYWLMEVLQLNVEQATVTFSDVLKNSYYEQALASATELGIVKGFADGSFGVGMELSRQDMAVFIYRAMNIADLSAQASLPVKSFADQSQIAPYAQEAISILQQAQFIRGNQRGEFKPQVTATHAEAAQLLYALLLSIIEK